jgi:hypothetical protein
VVVTIQPAKLTLAVEYSAPTPLDINGGVLRSTEPLGLDDALSDALIGWQRHFVEHFYFDRWPHWDSLAAADWHEAEGHRLFDRLSAALPETQVTLSLWPVEGDGREGLA